jgi:cytochrome c55X
MLRAHLRILRRLFALACMLGLPATAAEIQAATPSATRQQELRQMLARDCAICHADSLQGDLGPALTLATLAGRNEQALIDGILEGHEETAMPPWWWTLQEQEARWLVRFLRKTGQE